MTRRLVFVIPVRHPESVADWGVVRRDLSLTLASIAAQTGKDWECRVVANRGADLPPMPAGVELRQVDLALPDLPDRNSDRDAYFEAVRHDKGLRLYEGAYDAAPDSYVMTVDFDDFVSRRLAEFVAAHAGQPGWFLQNGYVWSGSGWVFLSQRFSGICGTSNIVRRDLLGPLEQEDGTLDLPAIRRHLGSHVFINKDLRDLGKPLAALPFPGAVYRIGNSQSTSGTGALFHTMTPARQMIRHPKRLSALLRYRRVNAGLQQEFTLP